MSTVEIEIDDYLTESDKRDIAHEAFRNAATKALETSNDVERFVGNAAAVIIWELSDRVFGGMSAYDLRQSIEKKVIASLKEIKTSDVIYRPWGSFRTKPTIAAEIIDATVAGNRGLIEDRVRTLLADTPRDEIISALHRQLDDVLNGVMP